MYWITSAQWLFLLFPFTYMTEVFFVCFYILCNILFGLTHWLINCLHPCTLNCLLTCPFAHSFILYLHFGCDYISWKVCCPPPPHLIHRSMILLGIDGMSTSSGSWKPGNKYIYKQTKWDDITVRGNMKWQNQSADGMFWFVMLSYKHNNMDFHLVSKIQPVKCYLHYDIRTILSGVLPITLAAQVKWKS